MVASIAVEPSWAGSEVDEVWSAEEAGVTAATRFAAAAPVASEPTVTV